MVEWEIAMGNRQAPLESIELPSIRKVIDQIRDHLATRFAPIAKEGDLAIIFVVEDDRSLSIRLRGDLFIVNRARDLLGEEDEIGSLLV